MHRSNELKFALLIEEAEVGQGPTSLAAIKDWPIPNISLNFRMRALRLGPFLVGQTTRGTRKRSGKGYRPRSYSFSEHTQIRRDPF